MTPLKDIQRLEELGINVFYLEYFSISGVYNSYNIIGHIIGDSMRGVELCNSYFEKIEDIKVESAFPPTVLALASISPIYVYGQNSFFSEKIYIAG